MSVEMILAKQRPMEVKRNRKSTPIRAASKDIDAFDINEWAFDTNVTLEYWIVTNYQGLWDGVISPTPEELGQ